MPQGGKHQPDDEYALRKSWRGEELSNGKEVGDASNDQGNQEGRFTHVAEIA